MTWIGEALSMPRRAMREPVTTIASFEGEPPALGIRSPASLAGAAVPASWLWVPPGSQATPGAGTDPSGH